MINQGNLLTVTVLQITSWGSIKKEPLKIEDKAEIGTVTCNFDENLEVKETGTVFESHKDKTQLDGHDAFMNLTCPQIFSLKFQNLNKRS